MKKFIIALCVSMFMVPVAYSANLKIGFVVVDQVLSQAPQVKAINEAMQKRFGNKKKELDKKEKDIKTLQDNYKRNELVMTQAKLDDMKKQIVAKLQDFKQSQDSLAQEVETMRSQELATLRDTMRDVIAKIAKKDKYDLILSQGIVYGAKELNISDEVLAAMKAEYKTEKK